MEIPLNCAGVSTTNLIGRVRVLQEETTRITNIIVNREMIEDTADNDPNRFCNRLCGRGEKLCGVCLYIYTQSVIINRNDITKCYTFEEHLQCNSFKEASWKIFAQEPFSILMNHYRKEDL